MRVREFVEDVNSILAALPKNESMLNLDIEELKLICWGLADSTLPATKKNLSAFYDFRMKQSIKRCQLQSDDRSAQQFARETDEVCAQLLVLFEKYVHPAIYDWASMVTEMLKIPNYQQRINLLGQFNLAKLSSLILNGVDFRTRLNDPNNFIGATPDHARTVLMTLGHYYFELLRTSTDTHDRITGGFTGYDKATKLKGIEQVMKFLKSGEPLSHFEKYLASDRFDEVVVNGTFGSEYTLRDVVKQGKLGDFCNMITFASKPENREPAQPKKGWFG